MNTEQRLREKVRAIIREEMTRLQEMTTTGNVAGYNVPTAFTGNKSKNTNRKKKIAQQLGYKLTKRGQRDLHRGADLMEDNSNGHQQ